VNKMDDIEKIKLKFQISKEKNHYVLEIITYDPKAQSHRYTYLERRRYGLEEVESMVQYFKKILGEGYKFTL